MKVKKDDNSVKLAKAAGLTFDKFEKVFTRLVDKLDIAYDEVDFFGKTLAETSGDTELSKYIELFKAVGIQQPTMNELLLVSDVTILGSGDCPDCGYEMEVVEEEERGDGYDTPYYYIPTEKHCPNCGAFIKL